MRYHPESIGSLIRPRLLSKGKMVQLKEAEHYVHLLSYITVPQELSTLFPEPPTIKFEGLNLGDTVLDPGGSYVAEITHFLIRENNKNYLVNKKTLPQAIKRRKELFGPRAKLYIHSLGVKLYRGFERSKNGTLKPIHPWTPPGCQDEVVLFFSEHDCIPLEQIVQYESCKPGNLVLFAKSNGLVIKKKRLNKPRFHSTNSWTSYAISILSNQSIMRFVPNRKFVIYTPNESNDGS
jgi:hypothetical protein